MSGVQPGQLARVEGQRAKLSGHEALGSELRFESLRRSFS